jgi:Lhr-like helicase
MPSYLIWKPIDWTSDEMLLPGDAFRHEGIVWRVKRAEGNEIWLGPWPADEPYPAGIKGPSS